MNHQLDCLLLQAIYIWGYKYRLFNLIAYTLLFSQGLHSYQCIGCQSTHSFQRCWYYHPHFFNLNVEIIFYQSDLYRARNSKKVQTPMVSNSQRGIFCIFRRLRQKVLFKTELHPCLQMYPFQISKVALGILCFY